MPTLAFARLSPGTDFGAKDGPADLAFLIAAPAGGDATHLKVLTQLARALVKKEFTDGLRSATSPAGDRRAGRRGRLRSPAPRPRPGPAAGPPRPRSPRSRRAPRPPRPPAARSSR